MTSQLLTCGALWCRFSARPEFCNHTLMAGRRVFRCVMTSLSLYESTNPAGIMNPESQVFASNDQLKGLVQRSALMNHEDEKC